MEFKEYELRAGATAIYPGKHSVTGLAYAALGLNGEAGEVAEKIKKTIRDDSGVLTDEKRQALLKEAGDVLWYLNALTSEIDSSLEEVARMNLEKLESRKARGKLKGEGDDR